MNTILITGSAQQANETGNLGGTIYRVKYDVNVWASIHGEQIQLITYFTDTLSGYTELWRIAKDKASAYFKNELLKDGAYTQFLDHIVVIG
jgi:hypothetical protein